MVIHSEQMVAWCGMNCTYCYVHHKKKKNCTGCRDENTHKPASCRKCKIKACAQEKGLTFCNECDEFPCVLIKRMDKSYQKRYDESLIKNFKTIESIGMKAYLQQEKVRLKCPSCEGLLNMHDKICSNCGKQFLTK